MANQNQTNLGCGGITFSGLLTLLFIGLKLTGTITWSWVWVLSPIWISWGLAIFIVLMFVTLMFLTGNKK